MRNAVIARDPVAQAAGESLVSEGVTAMDMALAAMLAGAARSSSASLLGAGGVLVAGVGVGMHFIDGRARAPGRGERRPKTPAAVPEAWTAAVPGLLEGVLAAHARFGVLPLSEIVRAAVSAVRSDAKGAGLDARLKFLGQFYRTGISAMERAGLLRSVLATVGPAAGGVFTRDDLVPVPAPVRELPTCVSDASEVLLPPRSSGRYDGTPPDALPDLPTESVIATDKQGVIVTASWVNAPTATTLEGITGFTLPALMPRPRKGVPRWRPGEPLPVPLPMGLLLHEGRVWAGVALCGNGALVSARDALVSARLASGGVSIALGDGSAGEVTADTVALWAIREGSDVRTTLGSVTG